MKSYLTIVLAIVSVVLIIVLYTTKQGDTTQITADAAAIGDLSNQLSSAQSQLAANSDALITLSNSLTASASGSLTLSNALADSQSVVAHDGEQITNLQTQVSTLTTDNQALNQQTAQLTNQLTAVTQQLTLAQTNLAGANKTIAEENLDYLNLEDRFRRNVAERIVMQRQFCNIPALQEQIARLKESPYSQITPDMIYAGLDVQVTSNGTFHVITRD
jgi:chromosome segregation ATPase